MNLIIDDSKTASLISIVNRANAEEGATQTTPEQFLTDRVNAILASFDDFEANRIKQENAEFIEMAVRLPADKQEQLKALVQQLAQS
jgi:hypothetical protein